MPTTATKTRLESELLSHVTEFWEASKGDAAKLRELCADTFTFVMADGINVLGREEFVAMMTKGDFKLNSFLVDSDGAVVRELAPDVATVAYRATSEFTMGGTTDKNDSYYTSTWVKNGGRWQCAFETESTAKGGA
jgi:uncharacterized protein (TIGR02246 family)